MINHEKPWKTNLEPWKTMKKHEKPWKTNLVPWKTMKTDLEPWQPNLEPWKTMKTNLEVEVEVYLRQLGKVLIFRDKQTNRTFLLYIDWVEEPSVSFQIICHVCQWPSSPSALSRTIAQFAKSIPRLLLPRFLDGSSHSVEVNDHVRDFSKLMHFYLKYLTFSIFVSPTPRLSFNHCSLNIHDIIF